MRRLRAGQTGSLLGVHLTTGEQGSVRAGEESQREGGWAGGPHFTQGGQLISYCQTRRTGEGGGGEC